MKSLVTAAVVALSATEANALVCVADSSDSSVDIRTYIFTDTVAVEEWNFSGNVLTNVYECNEYGGCLSVHPLGAHHVIRYVPEQSVILHAVSNAKWPDKANIYVRVVECSE